MGQICRITEGFLAHRNHQGVKIRRKPVKEETRSERIVKDRGNKCGDRQLRPHYRRPLGAQRGKFQMAHEVKVEPYLG
jgi:hypothetical protein